MAQKSVICKYCNKEINRDTAYNPKKGQYYCSENHYLSLIEKRKAKGNHSFKSAEGTDRRAFTDAIQDLYVNRYGWDKRKINWQILMSMSKTLLENNPTWTYETILYIIWYEQEILGLNLICKESHWNPLSLVDYYALEAELYYNECNEIQKSVENYNFDENIVVAKTSKNKKIKYKPINMEDI